MVFLRLGLFDEKIDFLEAEISLRAMFLKLTMTQNPQIGIYIDNITICKKITYFTTPNCQEY